MVSAILSPTRLCFYILKSTPIYIYVFPVRGFQILTNLTKMRDNSIDVFHHLFFDSDEYALVNNTNDQETDLSMNEDSVVESPMIQTLRNKLFAQLGDWFSFIEIKSQRNITMSLFVFCFSLFFFQNFYLVVRLTFLVLCILHLLIVYVDKFIRQHYILMIINIV
jgi:hypothetical protein